MKETTAFAVELFKMNGSVFESRFSDLYRINIDQRHVVFLYLQLLMNVDDLEPEIFGSVPNVTLSPILYVLFKARKTTPLYRNALTHARKFLGEKFNSEAIEIYLGNILFWARFCTKFDLQRLEIALELAISILSGIKLYSPSNKLIYNVQTVLDSFDFLEFDGNMNVKSLFFHLLAVTNIADAKIFSSRIVRDFLAAKSKGTTVTVNMTLLLEYIPHSLSPQDLHAVVNKGLSLDVCEGLLGPVLQFLRENPTRNLVVDKMNSEYFLRIVCVHKGVESKILHEMLQTAQIKSTVDLAASVSDSFISDVMMEGSLLGTMVCCQLARWSAHRLEELCAWINCNILEANERTIQLLREVSSVAISNGTWIDHIPKFLKVCVKKMSKLIVNKVFDLILNKNGLENNHLEELLSIVEIMQVTIPAKVAKKAKFLCVNSCHEVGFEVIVNILQISLDSKTNRFAFESAIEVISSPVSYNRFQEGEALCKLQKFVQNCPEIVNDIDSRIFSKVTDIISERSDFKCPLTLALLKSLIQNRQAVDCVRILNLCTSNSTYAEIITGTIIENSQCPVPVFSPGKTTLLQIFALLMTKDPKNCCQLRILKDLIRNYHGSLAEADVETLKIMKLFEKESKDSLLQYLGSWGDEQERENFRLSGASLSKIDPVWMANSLHWFDFSSDITRVATGSKNRLYARGISPAYDPAFFVLFTVAILDCPDLDPQLFIESKLMGLCILTLSSESLDTRILGHHVVSKAYNFIQNSDFKDRNSVTLFLDFFRNGIDPKGKRFLQIPSIITQFVAKGLMNLSKRESHFYPIFNRFCLQRNSLDVEDVPMFYELFYSQNDANRNERNWLLKLLLHGMNSRNDYKIFKRRHTIDILLGYYNINEGDSLSKKLILLVIPCN